MASDEIGFLVDRDKSVVDIKKIEGNKIVKNENSCCALACMPKYVLGEEFVDWWKDPMTGSLNYYCTLCGSEFTDKVASVQLHSKGPAHKIQYRAFKERETTEDRLVNARHIAISLSQEEFENVYNIVIDCEKALKAVSDTLSTVKRPGAADFSNESKKAAGNKVLVGVMRTGLLSAGLLMSGETDVELALQTADKPTKLLLHRITAELSKQLKPVGGKAAYDVTSDVDEACIVVTSLKEPKATCKIAVTSSQMRTHPFRYYSDLAAPDPVDVLSREKCEEALRSMRRARWHEANVYPLPFCEMVIRVFRDLCLRVPTWNPFDLWALQVLVQKCLSVSTENTSSPSRAVQVVFECLAAGILLQDSPGLYDPCEREPFDLTLSISLQERECITTSAQHALRLISFGQIHRILGMSSSALIAARRGGISSKRKLSTSEEYGDAKKFGTIDDA